MPVVSFDPDLFREAHPDHAALSDACLRRAFSTACLLLDNTETSPVPYDPESNPERAALLDLLVLHLLELARRGGAVGVARSAAEGSVNVSFDLPAVPGAWWYLQTQPGATFRQAILPYVVGGRYHSFRQPHPWG